MSRFYRIGPGKGHRGQCKACVRNIKRLQRNPDWRAPCVKCGNDLSTRSASGRRLCPTCKSLNYSDEVRPNGAPRLALLPCVGCGGPKTRFDKGRYCRICRSRWTGDERETTSKSLEKARYLFQTYGLSLRQYEVMLEMQEGKCVICRKPPTGRGFAVEHDHGPTKRVRGLACHRCNRNKIASNTAESAAIVAVYLASEFDARNL